MQVGMSDFVFGEYILLDWNVIQYLKNPRSQFREKDTELRLVIESLRRKYRFPFCEAHLRDLARSYSEENKERVYEDLAFLEELSQGIAVGSDNNQICMAKCSAVDLFREIISEQPREIELHTNIIPSATIDMSKMDKDHPLRPLLEKTNGVLVPELMDQWLNEKFHTFFEQKSDYTNLRAYIQKLKSEIVMVASAGKSNQYKDFLLSHMTPFFEVLEETDENELSTKWKNAMVTWLMMSFQNEENIPYIELISTAYTMLDLHPSFSEPLSKKNKLDNIVRDSKCIFYAKSGKYFITEDNRCAKKARFIFKTFHEKAQVLDIDSFIKRFS